MLAFVQFCVNIKDKMSLLKPLEYILLLLQGVSYLCLISIKDVGKKHFNYPGWLGPQS